MAAREHDADWLLDVLLEDEGFVSRFCSDCAEVIYEPDTGFSYCRADNNPACGDCVRRLHWTNVVVATREFFDRLYDDFYWE